MAEERAEFYMKYRVKKSPHVQGPDDIKCMQKTPLLT